MVKFFLSKFKDRAGGITRDELKFTCKFTSSENVYRFRGESELIVMFFYLKKKNIIVMCNSITEMFFVHQILGPNILASFFCRSININIHLIRFYSKKASAEF